MAEPVSGPTDSMPREILRAAVAVSLVTGLAGLIEGVFFGVVFDPFDAGSVMKGLSVVTFGAAYVSAGFVLGLILGPPALLLRRLAGLSLPVAAGAACGLLGAAYAHAWTKVFAAGNAPLAAGALVFALLGVLMIKCVRLRASGYMIAACILVTVAQLVMPGASRPVSPRPDLPPEPHGTPPPRADAGNGPHARNIIVILADTLRADHLSLYGYGRNTSPSLEALAARGVTFTRALVAKTKTSPSVASIFTGTWPHTHGIVTCRTTLPEETTTLAEILRARGFATHSIVANSNVGASFNFDQGFDSVDEIWADPGQSDASGVTDHALSWLEKHESLQDGPPFFLYVHYIDPHAPYAPPAPFSDQFMGDPLYGAYARVKVSSGDGSIGSIRPSVLLSERPTDVDFYVARYDGEVAYLDHHLGRLLERVRALGLEDDTLIVFTGDHGEALSEHDVFFSHGEFAYEDTAHVPLVASLPGRIRAGSRVDEVVSIAGLAATLLEAAGLPAANTMEAPSFWYMATTRDDTGHPAGSVAFIEGGSVADAISTSIRTDRWKLIENPQGFDRGPRRFDPRAALSMNRKEKGLELVMTGREFLARFELYDLEADPGETINLAGSEPEVEGDLLGRLRAWRAGGLGRPRLRETSRDELPDEVLRNLRSLGYIN